MLFHIREPFSVCNTFQHTAIKSSQTRVTIKEQRKRLTAHLGITLVNDQLDAQFFYFIIRLLQSSTCFEQCRAHHQEVKLY